MKSKNLKRAILLQVSSSKQKLPLICKMAASHFENSKKLYILTSDETSAAFVDQLLWSYPKESMLPHEISNTSSHELICVGYNPSFKSPNESPNESPSIFNLKDNPVEDSGYNLIYDFEDFSSEEKKTLSHKKLLSYKENGYSIASF